MTEDPKMHDVYLLFDTPFFLKGDHVVEGKLSPNALEVINTKAERLGGLRHVTLEELAQGRVQPMGYDGATYYTCVETPKGNFSMRFQSK